MVDTKWEGSRQLPQTFIGFLPFLKILCVCTCVYMCMCIYVYMCMFVHVCTYVCMCMFMYVYVCMFVHVFVCMCARAYVCMANMLWPTCGNQRVTSNVDRRALPCFWDGICCLLMLIPKSTWLLLGNPSCLCLPSLRRNSGAMKVH